MIFETEEEYADFKALVFRLKNYTDEAILKPKKEKQDSEYKFNSFLDQSELPLGLRNNNPGNLRRTKIAWQGELIDTQNKGKGFERFESVEYGIRANAIDIIGDIKKDGLNTVSKLINEYAPEHENNTGSYIKFVCTQLGISFNDEINLTYSNLVILMDAIYHIELGEKHAVLITKEMIEKALTMINSSAKKYMDD